MLTLLLKGHRVDPNMAETCYVFTTAHRLLTRRPDLLEQVQRVYDLRKMTPKPHLQGPVGALLQTASKVGCELSRELALVHHGVPLPLLGQQKPWTHHMIRDLARRQLWLQLKRRLESPSTAGKRADLQGFTGTVDVHATIAL